MTKFGELKLQNGSLVEQNVIEIDLSKVPSSDPLAFSFGLSYGQRCRDKREINHGSKHSELAQEYLRGFLLGFKGILVPEGTKIKKGYERCYALSDKNILKRN